MQTIPEKITILHFNDVYNLEEVAEEPVGGVARFKTALDKFADQDPLILFSGDLFQPSLLGTLFHGEQMIKPINDFKVDVACFGNHEFELEIDMLTGFIKRCNFPWLMSNIRDKETRSLIAGAQEYHIFSKYGLKFGFIGLAEKDWIHTTNSLDDEDIIFEDYIVCAQRLTKILKEEHKCDLIIALTHMRTYNDIKLAESFTEFDLILGGHDHINKIIEVNGTYIIKSGSDFREFNKITLTLPKNSLNSDQVMGSKKCGVSVETVYVTKDFAPEPSLVEHTNFYFEKFKESMDLPMGVTLTELETTFSKIRSSEQNLPNFIADIVRLETESDCSLLNTGTIRSNTVFPKGIVKMGHIRLMLPYADLIMQLELTGAQLLQALENSVSKYPALEGRFPAVSGVSFEFDPKKEPLKRINLESIRIRNGPLDLNETYTMGVKKWILEGKDGYDVFTKTKKVTDEGVAEELHGLFQKFFELGHDPNFIQLFKAEKEGTVSPQHGKHNQKKLHFYQKMKSLISDVVEVDGQHYVAINPRIEGRIRIVESS